MSIKYYCNCQQKAVSTLHPSVMLLSLLLLSIQYYDMILVESLMFIKFHHKQVHCNNYINFHRPNFAFKQHQLSVMPKSSWSFQSTPSTAYSSSSSFSPIRLKLDMTSSTQDNKSNIDASILSNNDENDIVDDESTNIRNVEGMATFLSNRLGWVVVRNIKEKQQQQQQKQQQQKQQPPQQQSIVDDTTQSSSTTGLQTTDCNVSVVVSNKNDDKVTVELIENITTTSPLSSSDDDSNRATDTANASDKDVVSSSVSTDNNNDPVLLEISKEEISNDSNIDTKTETTTSSLSSSSSIQTESPLYVPNIPSVISLGYGKALSVTESNVPAIRDDLKE
jgi:hypothetical protein